MIAVTIDDKYVQVINKQMDELGKKLQKEMRDNMEIFRGMWDFCNQELKRVAPPVGAVAGKGSAAHIPLSPPGDMNSMA